MPITRRGGRLTGSGRLAGRGLSLVIVYGASWGRLRPAPFPKSISGPILNQKRNGTAMKIFLDTADVAEIREYAASGLVDGVTTNPSLAAKTGKDYVESLKEICAIVPGAVSAEVLATDYEGMLKEAAVFTRIAKNIAVKVPLTWDGLKACAK